QIDFNLALDKTVEQWESISRFVSDIGGEVHLADAIQRELDKSSLEMAKFRAEQLNLFQRTWDSIAHFLSNPTAQVPTFGGARQDEANQQQEEYNEKLRAAVALTLDARQNTEEWDFYQDHLNEGIDFYDAKVTESQET